MSTHINPRLSRIDVVLNSLTGCISDAAKEFSWTPKMSFCEISSQPRMFAQKFKGRTSFKQLQRLADTHCRGQLNKQMDMVSSDMKLINFTSILSSGLADKPFAVNSDSIELEGIHGVFAFPHEVECILPEGMLETLQIHFFPPESAVRNKAHANSIFCRGLISSPLHAQENKLDKFMEGRIPPLLESKGILRLM